jgi:hypothetical protein
VPYIQALLLVNGIVMQPGQVCVSCCWVVRGYLLLTAGSVCGALGGRKGHLSEAGCGVD